MLVQTLDGETYEFKIPEKIAKGNKRGTSQFHKIARKMLKQLFSGCRIYEELPIYIGDNQTLYVDFFVVSYNLFVEVHGQQHYDYNSHFYKNKIEWLKAIERDKRKAEWCKINNLKLVTLKYNEQDKWQEQLKNF
jgi:very-short-patch-repair endonuclease